MKSSLQARGRPDIPTFANCKLAHRRGNERIPCFGCAWNLPLPPSEVIRPCLAKNPLVEHPEKKAGLRPFIVTYQAFPQQTALDERLGPSRIQKFRVGPSQEDRALFCQEDC